MCVFSSPTPPPPPPLPEPRPTPPMPEETASAPITGRKRKEQPSPNKDGSQVGTRTTGAAATRRRLGTSSLRIPLLANASRDLNY
tara:strand:- start:37 stop:291 length:255 start_codon:yes stop_codon:yes gene_type:complete